MAQGSSTGQKPNIPQNEVNPETHYLGNRPRIKVWLRNALSAYRGQGRANTLHVLKRVRLAQGEFGNLLDPKSEIRYLIENKRVFRLKEDLNTEPKFYYFFTGWQV